MATNNNVADLEKILLGNWPNQATVLECGNCKQKKATHLCLECKQLQCADCVQMHKGNVLQAVKSHRVQILNCPAEKQVAFVRFSEPTTCSLHDDDKYRFWMADDRPACATCVAALPAGQPLTLIRDVAQQAANDSACAKDSCTRQLQRILEEKPKLAASLSEATALADKLKEIETIFTRLRATVEQRKGRLDAKLRTSADANTKLLEMQHLLHAICDWKVSNDVLACKYSKVVVAAAGELLQNLAAQQQDLAADNNANAICVAHVQSLVKMLSSIQQTSGASGPMANGDAQSHGDAEAGSPANPSGSATGTTPFSPVRAVATPANGWAMTSPANNGNAPSANVAANGVNGANAVGPLQAPLANAAVVVAVATPNGGHPRMFTNSDPKPDAADRKHQGRGQGGPVNKKPKKQN